MEPRQDPPVHRRLETAAASAVLWLLRRPELLLILAVLTFLPFVVQGDPSVRWGAFATLWGVLGAGVVIWWALEQHSEPLQFEFRLRRAREPLIRLLPETIEVAAMSAAVVLGLPKALELRLQRAQDLAEATAAIERIRLFARNVELGTEEPLQGPQRALPDILNDLNVLLSRMESLALEIEGLLGEASSISEQLRTFKRLCQELLEYRGQKKNCSNSDSLP